MRRSLLRLVAIILAVFALEPAAPRADVPPGLAYDEVVRLTVDATPPPPGAFDLPERRRGLDRAGERTLRAAAGLWADRLGAYIPGRITKRAFWNGWERTDDPAAQSAVIRKCDLHQTIALDLGRRTYRMLPDPTPPPDPPGGTVQATDEEAVSALGETPVGSSIGEGYRIRDDFAMSEPTGACRSGTAGFTTTVVYDRRTPPPSSCPVVAGSEPFPEAAVQFLTAGGCRPALTAAKSGPVAPDWHVALYRSITTGPVAITVARDNLRDLGPDDAALFEIPPGFTAARP